MIISELIELTNLGDDRGSLVVLEHNKQVPFNIERVYSATYYIYSNAFMQGTIAQSSFELCRLV